MIFRKIMLLIIIGFLLIPSVALANSNYSEKVLDNKYVNVKNPDTSDVNLIPLIGGLIGGAAGIIYILKKRK